MACYVSNSSAADCCSLLKCFVFVASSSQESFFFFDTVSEFNFSMSNLGSFVDTQNLNYFLSSSQAVNLNDN